MDTRRVVLKIVYWTLIPTSVAFFLAFQIRSLFHTVPEAPTATTTVLIQPNLTLRQIARQLNEAEVLEAPWKFKLITRILRKERTLRPGEYTFRVPSAPYTILQMLMEGRVTLHRVTIPEGYNLTDIARVLGVAGLAPEEALLDLFRSPSLIQKLGLPGPTLEGFLFPETYLYSRVDGPEKLITGMVQRFRMTILPEDEARAKALGFSLLQWVTLASIIEKESSIPSEHPLVSSVFHNRLKKRMRLQSDPTVIYGIPNFNGNITKKDLLTPTPYNTYTRYGLPPGPIANPGASALRAAVNPANTSYLYFVADRKGAHVFAETYEEHQKNVAQFQLRKPSTAAVVPTPKSRP